MDFRSTYFLGDAFTRGAFRAKEVDDVLGGNDIGLTSGDWATPIPLRFRQYEGTNVLDCVGTQRANIKLLSDRVLEALRASDVTGWDTHSVRLEAMDGSEIVGYNGLVVKGRCGAIDNAKSIQVERVVVGNPKGRATVWKGLYFAEDSWDGSDLFRPAATGYIFATQRVRDALDRAKVTNLRFTPLADFERPMLF